MSSNDLQTTEDFKAIELYEKNGNNPLSEFDILRRKLRLYDGVLKEIAGAADKDSEAFYLLNEKAYMMGMTLYGRLLDVGFIDKERYILDTVTISARYQKSLKRKVGSHAPTLELIEEALPNDSKKLDGTLRKDKETGQNVNDLLSKALDNVRMYEPKPSAIIFVNKKLPEELPRKRGLFSWFNRK